MPGFDPNSYLAEDAQAAGGFDPHAYIAEDANPSGAGAKDGVIKSAINSLPMVGGAVGGILGTPADALTGPAGTIGGAAIGGYLGTAAKNLINSYYDPASAPKTATGAVVDATKGGVEQGLLQGTGEAVAPYIAGGANAASDALKTFAQKKAVAATGATGKQALKFAPEAGQELLDRGIVKFGDSQAKIAGKATDALDAAGNKISSVLTDLDKRGATLDQADIVDRLRNRAQELSEDPAHFDTADSLNRLADKMEERIASRGGNSEIPLSKAEATKRGFQTKTNYNSPALDLSVSKEAASVYQKAVEDDANKFDPKAAEAFTEAKKSYRLLNPIQEAAEKRASTLNQSPHGGLLDTAAIIAGEGLAGAPGAIAAPIVRRAVSTRSASSMAAAASAAGKLIGSVPAVAESAIPAAIQSQGGSVTPIGSGVGNMIALPAAAAQQNQPDSSKVAQSNANRTPARGPDAWAKRGVQNLGIDSALAQTLLSDPKGKQLLIQASDLSPNSKAMNQIMNQIQKGWGQ